MIAKYKHLLGYLALTLAVILALAQIHSQQNKIQRLTATQQHDLSIFKAVTGEQQKRDRQTQRALTSNQRALAGNQHGLAAAQRALRASTLQIAQLDASRAADNANAIRSTSALAAANRQEVTALAAAQSTLSFAQMRIGRLQAKTAALEANQARLVKANHLSDRRALFDTCTQVEAVKKAVHFTLVTIFAGSRLTPAQRAGLDKLIAQFAPHVCVRP